MTDAEKLDLEAQNRILLDIIKDQEETREKLKDEIRTLIAGNDGYADLVYSLRQSSDALTQRLNTAIEANQASLDKVSGMMAVLGMAQNGLGWWTSVNATDEQQEQGFAELTKALSTVPAPLAVVSGYRVQEFSWPFVDSDRGSLISVHEHKPAHGWEYVPVTVIVMPKEAK